MRILEEFWYGNIEPTEYDTTTAQNEASSNSEKLHPFNIAWLMIYA